MPGLRELCVLVSGVIVVMVVRPDHPQGSAQDPTVVTDVTPSA
ncbi:hypothetical protein AB0L57_21110 [Nocardia sp. NPDC052254]